jgi:hypothetical protein
MIRSSQVVVGDDATMILSGDGRCTVRNRGDAPVYIGGADVTVENGFQLDPGEAAGMKIGLVDLYGVVESGEQPIHALIVSL